MVGTEEAAAPGWGVGVEPQSHAVDSDVVVKPTQCGEVVRVVVATMAAVSDVVGLEPVSAVTTIDGAATVSPCHEPADRRRDRSCFVCGCYRFPVDETDHLYSATTKDSFQHVWSDAGPELDLSTRLTMRPGGKLSLYKHGGQRITSASGVAVWGG